MDKGLTGILLAGGRSRRFSFNKIELKIDKVPLFIDQIFKLSFFCNEILICSSDENYRFISNELAVLDKHYIRYRDYCNLSELPPVRIIRDPVMPGKSLKSMGPVVGIESGLEYARNLFSMVIAFDMPFISYNLLYLLEEIWNSRHGKKDAFIIKTEKGFEALCGIYSKNCLDSVKDHIEKGVYKISEVFHNPGTEFILLNRQGIRAGSNNIDFYKLNDRIIDNLNFFNINTADDYDFFIKIWDFKISLFQESLNQYGRGSSICEDKYHCEKWKYFFYRN